MAPKKKTAKTPPKEYDYSGLEKGMKLQAEWDGTYYTAEVVQVSTSKNRAKAPVKVHFPGYTAESDTWMGGDYLKSKNIKVKKAEKKEPKALTDGVVTLAPYFKIKDLAKFKSIWQEDYKKFAHKEDCVHYAFCFTDDNRAHCREAYPNAEKVLQHLADVDVPLKAVLDGPADLERLEVHGPKAELDKLRDALTPLGCLFYETEWGFRPRKPAMEDDTVCHLYPYFKLKDQAAFKKTWLDAYPATKKNQKAEKSHQYAFSFEPTADVASCRESYEDAEGILLHLKNVDVPLKSVLDGPAELLRLELHGPASEIEKLKPALEPLGCQFFTTGWGFRNAVGRPGKLEDKEPRSKAREPRKIWMFALTGGPCGGKGSCQPYLKEQLKEKGYDVYTVPEVPSIFFVQGGGCCTFPGLDAGEKLIQFESAIIKLQLQIEESFKLMAQSTGKKSIIFCDRGIMDIACYLPGTTGGDAWKSILKANKLVEFKMLSRYAGVIHLQSAAIGAEKFYKTGDTQDDSGNKVFRREGPEEARELDAKVLGCWEKHKNLAKIVNESGATMADKCKKALDAVLAIVEPPEAVAAS